MSKHEHHWHGCEHKNLAFCKQCELPYCKDCNMEWQKRSIWNYNGIYSGNAVTDGTGSYTVSQAAEHYKHEEK